MRLAQLLECQLLELSDTLTANTKELADFLEAMRMVRLQTVAQP
jgi:hypothetical protein